MTREHKVALIVGFSLILLIAVLLSDHFSRARSARLEPIREGEYVLTQPDAPVDPLLSMDSAPVPAPTVSEAGAADAAPVGEANGFSQIAAASPGETPDLATQSALNDTQLAAEIARQGGTVIPGAGGTITILPPPVETAPPLPAESTSKTSTPATTPAESIRLHPVKKGENLYRIAEKYYGSGAKWKKLADANRDRVSADGTVREGVQLRIPDVPATRTTSGSDRAAKPTGKPGPSKAPAKPGPIRIAKADATASPKTYTVRRGDTLGEIALKTLGSSRRVREIKALNGIEDEDDIAAGVVLKIPGA